MKTGAQRESHVVGTPQFGSSYGQQACVTCADSTVTMCSSHVAESGPCSGFGQPRKWYLSATRVFGQQAVRCDSFDRVTQIVLFALCFVTRVQYVCC